MPGVVSDGSARAARDSKIDELHLTGERDHDVFQGDVAVDDPSGVGMRERSSQLADDVNCNLDGDAAVVDAARSRDELGDIPTLDVLLDDERLASDLAHFDGFSDRTVREGTSYFGLTPESAQAFRARESVGNEAFDDTEALVAGRTLQREKDVAHPAGTERADEHVGTPPPRKSFHRQLRSLLPPTLARRASRPRRSLRPRESLRSACRARGPAGREAARRTYLLGRVAVVDHEHVGAAIGHHTETPAVVRPDGAQVDLLRAAPAVLDANTAPRHPASRPARCS